MTRGGYGVQASVVTNERGLTMASMTHRNWSSDRIAAMTSLISDGVGRAVTNLDMGSFVTISVASEKATLYITEFDVEDKVFRIAAVLGHGPLKVRSFLDRVRNRDFVQTVLIPAAKDIQEILGVN